MDARETLKQVGLVVFGMVVAVIIFLLVVGIGCAANGLTFGEQITAWFGTASETVEEVVEDLTETVSSLL